MAWWILLAAGLLEIVWATGLKYTEGFTRFWPSCLTVIALAGSMYLLSVAVRDLPIGTAYAVWVGIGAAGTAVLGMAILNEPVSVARLFFMALLGIAILGLKFSTAAT
ncbi:DMT family transporter [Bremerella alba]|uniref:Guanidinium exporter n=1 Tax=Bremerella alba TaxID=980252 RepID=A0A7V8V8P8_9BACT|nr:multidrug efflux SMR transporter [Bremerella alba]MBA2117019.1 Quaternary ammonium compound-resistance protein SugE [Bremerella alba]